MTFRKAWKKFWQRVLHLGIIQWVIVILIAIPIWLVYLTCRVKIYNYETFLKYRRRPAIFAFWHGRAMMLSPVICVGRMRSYIIASRHADGRMMAKLQRLFGLEAIYGSSTAGGISVLRAGIRALGRGDHSMCISPDGPSGPSMRVQSGALYMAKMSGAPIIPVCYSASRARFMSRWDRFMIAMPFSRVVVRVGEPVFVPRDATDEQFEEIRKNIEDIMTRQLREMDDAFGLFRVEQDLKSSEFKQQRRDARAARRNAKRGGK